MRIHDERGRARRVRRSKLLIAVAAAALVVAVPAAWAAHDFADVPDSNPFHSAISAIKRAGITQGFPDGTYRPGDNVSREAMAAFMHRGFSRAGVADGPEVSISTEEPVQLAALAISVPGAPGGTQFVKLDASVGTSIQTSTTGCPCGVSYAIYHVESGAFVSQTRHESLNVGDAVGNFVDATGAVNTVVDVPSGTTQTFRLVAEREGGTGTITAQGTLTAITAPFGRTGVDVLGGTGVARTGTVPALPKRR